MAIWQVGKDGNAPKDAKVGDQIVTQGGTYEIIDGSQYQGMSPAQLKQAGVGYNQSSGKWSKRVSGVKSNDIALLNRNSLDQWFGQANNLAKQQLMSAYNTNISNVKQAYNKNKANYKKQIDATNADYEQYIRDAQADAYSNAIATAGSAANRGMANSTQSQAAASNAYFAAGDTMARLASNRSTLLNDIYTNLNTLTENYNIQLSELEKNRLADELAAMSNNQLQYLAQVMNIDQYNADAYNNLRNNQMQMEWQSSEAQKDRDFQARQAALSRSYSGRQAAAQAQAEAEEKKMNYFLEQISGLGNKEIQDKAYALTDKYYAGLISYDDWYNQYQNLIKGNVPTTLNTPYGQAMAGKQHVSGGLYDGGRNFYNPSVAKFLTASPSETKKYLSALGKLFGF